jgi:hypothetical protein
MSSHINIENMRESVERETVERGGVARASAEKRREYLQHLDKVTTSFFFTNFPEDASSEVLWKLFLKFGRVGEVYIPKKLDKRGRRFGFVKFKEVGDVEELSERLRDVWLGSFKLLVNLSRFARPDSRAVPNQADSDGLALQSKDPAKGKSFIIALLSGGSRQKPMVMKVPVNEELCKELQGSVVGKLAREKDVKRIQTTLYMEGFQSVSVTNMGGDMVLLRSPVMGDVDRLLRSKNECLHYYFSELKPWNPGLLAVQREVWIQIYGIPLHIWGENFFKQVGSSLGTFMDFDEVTARMARFDVARVKILTSTWAFIDVELKVEVEGVYFDLWVVEERGSHRSVVVMGDDGEDEGSRVVPSEEEDGFSVGGADSGEDKKSGDEADRDVRAVSQHGGRIEGKKVQEMCTQETQKRKDALTVVKSTYVSNSQKDSPSVPFGDVGNEVAGVRQIVKRNVLAVLDKGEVREKSGSGGAQGGKEIGKVGLVDSRPDPPIDPTNEDVGFLESNQSEAQEDLQMNGPFVPNLVMTGCLGEVEESR